MSLKQTAGFLLCLCFMASAQAAPVAFHLEHGTPAQAEGDSRLDGLQWALLVFHGPASDFTSSLPTGASHTNHTWMQLDAHQPGLADVDPLQPLPASDPQPIAPGQELALRFAHPWSSLYVEATRIQLVASQTQAFIDRAAEAEPVSFYEPKSEAPRGTHREGAFVVPTESPVFGFKSLHPVGMGFTLLAQGVRTMEWHNATVACSSPGHCPDGAGSSTSQIPADVRITTMSYANVASTDGALSGSGLAWLAVVGGPELDFRLDGVLRLPRTYITGRCGDEPCPNPDGLTFTANGDLLLSGLRPGSGTDRLLADARGNLTAANFDEQSVLPLFGEAVVAAAAVGLTTALVLWFLFARKPNADPLEHPRARSLRDLIHAEPGLSFRELLRRTGWSNNSVRRHLDKLLVAHIIAKQAYLNSERYFENHGRYRGERDWKRRVLLGDPDLKKLQELVLNRPGITQKALLAEAKEAWGWPRTSTQDRLRVLAEERLIAVERQGRTNHYRTEARPA